MSLLASWLFSALGLLVAGRALGPSFRLEGGFGRALVLAAGFGILNALFGWLLFVLLGFATLGLGFVFAFVTRLIVQALVLKLTAALSSSLRIQGFWPAVVAAAIISVAGAIGERLV